MKTPQIEQWKGEFGRAYSDRNIFTPEELNAFYVGNYGVSRNEMNRRFLKDIPSDAQILEIGCNIGNQLLMLESMGFDNLHGIEIQTYALQQARARLKKAKLSEASAFKIPYPDEYFDLVFTSGVLIHIAPEDLSVAMAEIARCTRSYVWGLEYFADEPTEVKYRGNDRLLWKMDYARRYLEHCPDLEFVQEEKFAYLQDSNVDSMFLLKKKPRRVSR